MENTINEINQKVLVRAIIALIRAQEDIEEITCMLMDYEKTRDSLILPEQELDPDNNGEQ